MQLGELLWRPDQTIERRSAKLAATSLPVTRLAIKAFSGPTRGASFRLIVSLSREFMGGHFHGI